MSSFEVAPVGTLEEITGMRKLSHELIELADQKQDYLDLIDKIEEIRSFYHSLAEKYPVTL